QSVIGLLEQELLAMPGERTETTPPECPAPLNPQHWEAAWRLPFEQVQLAGPWSVRNWPRLAWIDHVLHTSAVGARLSFRFEGRGLALGFDFGRSSAEFRYQLDDG